MVEEGSGVLDKGREGFGDAQWRRMVGTCDNMLETTRTAFVDDACCRSKNSHGVSLSGKACCLEFVEGKDDDDLNGKSIATAMGRVRKTRSITLVETAHAHAVPRTTSALIVVL